MPPTVGRIVHYRPRKGEWVGLQQAPTDGVFAALVIGINADDETPNLRVFGNGPDSFVVRRAQLELDGEEKDGTWHWPVIAPPAAAAKEAAE